MKHVSPFEFWLRTGRRKPTEPGELKIKPWHGLRPGDRITDAQKEAFWRADADKALRAARAQMRAAGITDQSFLLPLASVNFQLGPGWKDKFVKTWSLISARRYGAAARRPRIVSGFGRTRRTAFAPFKRL